MHEEIDQTQADALGCKWQMGMSECNTRVLSNNTLWTDLSQSPMRRYKRADKLVKGDEKDPIDYREILN